MYNRVLSNRECSFFSPHYPRAPRADYGKTSKLQPAKLRHTYRFRLQSVSALHTDVDVCRQPPTSSLRLSSASILSHNPNGHKQTELPRSTNRIGFLVNIRVGDQRGYITGFLPMSSRYSAPSAGVYTAYNSYGHCACQSRGQKQPNRGIARWPGAE